MPTSRPYLGALRDSPYAAELERGAGSRSFAPEVEAEYVRVRLLDSRTLIRLACALTVVLAVVRGAEKIFLGTFGPLQPILITLVLAGSCALTLIAFSRFFERWYLPVAQIVVPVRNVLATIGLAQTVASGQPEALMLMSLMVVSPFFFLGLRFRTALLTVAVTLASFVVAAAVFGMEVPMFVRALVLLACTATACAIAARHVERWSRTSFLESHLVEELAQHDTLTGLKNRRVFDEHLERLWRRAIAASRPLAIFMIDLDHFKAYNDRYGHQAGDRTLRRVAQALQTLVGRPLDVLARYGGEELAVIACDVDRPQAEALAEKMRRAVNDLEIEHRGSRSVGVVTVRVGVAVVSPSEDRHCRGALQLADQALYDAKVHGRNRVVVLDEADHRMLVTGVFSRSSLAAGG